MGGRRRKEGVIKTEKSRKNPEKKRGRKEL